MERGAIGGIVKRSWKAVLGASVVAGLAAFLWASSRPPVYEAEARLLSGPVNTDYGTLRASGELARTYAELARSRDVLSEAIDAAGADISTASLLPNVITSANTVTRLVTVRVRHGEPEVAAALADSITDALIDLSSRPSTPDLALVEELLAQPGIEAMGADTREVIRQAATAVIDSPLAGRLTTVEPAEVPTTPVEPQVPLVTAIGLLAGGAAAAAIVLAMEPAAARSAPSAVGDVEDRLLRILARGRDRLDDEVGA